MRVEKFKADYNLKVSELIMKKHPLSYNQVMKIIHKKDVKINQKRISKDELVSVNDEIVFYFEDSMIKNKIDIVYEDENIVVVFKPRQIEVENFEDNSLKNQVEKIINSKCYAVHRLDRNTIGLVIFAKNKPAKDILDLSFKDRTIEKYYLALVYGSAKKQDDMVSYLKKDKEKSLVYISDYKQDGYERIETKYKLLKTYENHSLVEVELVTGKTHQIRAHFAHIGCPIIGDEKYGYNEINKEYKMKYQCLCAYKIKFHFGDNLLNYLDKKEITLPNEKIDFLKLCK